MVYITFVIAIVYCIFVGLIAMDTLIQLFAESWENWEELVD
jgi:hypothetical protein